MTDTTVFKCISFIFLEILQQLLYTHFYQHFSPLSNWSSYWKWFTKTYFFLKILSSFELFKNLSNEENNKIIVSFFPNCLWKLINFFFPLVKIWRGFLPDYAIEDTTRHRPASTGLVILLLWDPGCWST